MEPHMSQRVALPASLYHAVALSNRRCHFKGITDFTGC